MTDHETFQRLAPYLFIPHPESDWPKERKEYLAHRTHDTDFIHYLIERFGGEEDLNWRTNSPEWALRGRERMEPFLKEVLPYLPYTKRRIAMRWLSDWPCD